LWSRENPVLSDSTSEQKHELRAIDANPVWSCLHWNRRSYEDVVGRPPEYLEIV
jgi:hypothetical protein